MIFPELLMIVTVSMGMVDLRYSAEHTKDEGESYNGTWVKMLVCRSSNAMRMRCATRGSRPVLKGESLKGNAELRPQSSHQLHVLVCATWR